MNNAQILARSLVNLGVKRIFGFSGATILPVFHAIEELDNVKGASFLEAVCDVDEIIYPRIAAGEGYKDIDLGPYMGNK